MSYRRVLLIVELGTDARPVIAAIARVAPEAEHLIVIARWPARKFAWFFGAAPAELRDASNAALDALRAAAEGVASTVDVKLAPDLSTAALEDLAAAAGVDLLVAGSLAFSSLSILADLRKQRSIAVLWVPEGAPQRAAAPIANVVCVSQGRQGRGSIAAFLRDHSNPAQHVTIPLAGRVPHHPSAVMDVAGIVAAVEFVSLQGVSARRWLDQRIQQDPNSIDLLVLARVPLNLFLGAQWPVPSLLLPPAPIVPFPLARALDAADLVDHGGPLHARFELAVGLGRRPPIPDQEVAFVSGGHVVATLVTNDGEVELPADCHAESYGVFRVQGHTAPDPLHSIEQHVSVIRPGVLPLLLLDPEVSDDELHALHPLQGTCDLLAVRIRPTRSYRSIRMRLRKAGITPHVVDGSVVLDEGTALDVPDAVDAVRLARAAGRMRSAGFRVAAIVYSGDKRPATIGFTAVHAAEAVGIEWSAPSEIARPVSFAARFEATTAAPSIPGNRIALEIDNVTARGWLLHAIETSTRRVHVQVYMAEDDDVGREVETALKRASERGVTVRLLVDSLHAFHGSLGAHNPLLERLGSMPGIELRVSKPITTLPSLEDLKQRDHRKVVVVDNQLALLGGRNLSNEYYRGFDEVALTATSTWREVPWVDAGARVEGCAVAVLERSFLDAWTEAGGTPFDVDDVAPAGTTPMRVVIHRGLRDAYTLEAYLALIETATSHIYLVNGFPLSLEIQHALLRALRRGVRLVALLGNLTPMHGGEPFTGPWASARVAATELVHSRMDALIAAGAEAYQFTVAHRANWAPDLGDVSSHVHAKVMSADGRVCAVGSANMDITAGYWESELLAVVEDVTIASALEARIQELIAGSKRVAPDDPEWQERARRREWMRHWPGVLAV